MTAVDWSILELDPEMALVAEQAARKVVRQYGTPVLEFDDLVQEGLIMMATHAEDFRSSYATGGLGGVQHRLWCDLVNLAKPDSDKARRRVSYEAQLEAVVSSIEL